MNENNRTDQDYERHLLHSHRSEPKDLFILNELVYFYSIRNDTAQANHYESLLRKVVDENVALNSK
jgi:hypothetical protein